MASTYTVQDLIDATAPQTSVGTQRGPLAANLAIGATWEAFAWRERKVDLPPFWLVPGRQDYGAPNSSVPSDFGSLLEAQVRRITDDGNDIVTIRELTPVNTLPVSNWQVWPPDQISYQSEEGAFRLSYVTPDNVGSPEYFVGGVYLKRHTKITGSNAHTETLPWDDVHFLDLVRIMRYAWAVISPGGIAITTSLQRVGPQVQSQGLHADALAAVDSMIMREGGQPGFSSISPESSLTEW